MGIRFIYSDDSQRTDFERSWERLMADSLGPDLTEKLLNKQLHH
jgi:type IV pilus assembly protein PilZ